MSAMSSSRPYLVRAMYEWMVDSGMTPHLLVDASDTSVRVPRQHVEDGKIVLNIGPTAVQALELGNAEVRFNARFGGVPMDVRIPVSRVLAIYARENGQGMMFEPEDAPPPGPEERGPSRPSLKVVK